MKVVLALFFCARSAPAVQPINCFGPDRRFSTMLASSEEMETVVAQVAMGYLYETGPGVVVQNL